MTWRSKRGAVVALVLAAATQVAVPTTAHASSTVVRVPCTGEGGQVTVVTRTGWVCYKGSGVISPGLRDVSFFHPGQRRGRVQFGTEQPRNFEPGQPIGGLRWPNTLTWLAIY